MIYVEKTMEACEVIEFGTREAAVFSCAVPGAEGPNEDSAGVFVASDTAGVLAVADGAGGTPSGEQASRLAIEALRRAIKNADPSEDSLRSPILDAFEKASEAIRELGIGALTTLAVAEIYGNSLRTYHAGDSKILVTGQRGKLKFLTMDHSPVGYAVEAGVLDENEAMHHEDRNLVSNFVGSADMRIEVGPVIELSPNDTVVVGSDGLFDNLYWEEVAEAARKGPIDESATELIQICARRMNEPKKGQPSKPDDLTLVMFRPG